MFISLLIKEVKQSLPAIVIIGFITVILMGFVVMAKSLTGIPLSQFVRDPNSIANAPFYNGFYSQLGLFVWFASAALCFFLANALSGATAKIKLKTFFISSACISLMLGLDDAFLLHEDVFPSLGVSEAMVMMLYGLSILIYLTCYFKFIFTTRFLILGCAFFFFALSVGYDMILPDKYHSYAIEDSAKMAGILAWFYYFYTLGLSYIKPLTQK
ncbi:hypothetical protein [Pseudoalteromonas piratica]|uniref:hypothetical protein n=1 Tax=Pseudoalteromonas piratica TaxID=1348114 RepID=UPI00069091DF|nr:hypothetical protein [Pseudoalteromonas piratica]